MKFAKVTQRCLGCRASLSGGKDAGDAALCSSCKVNEAQVYLSKLQELQAAERSFWQTSVMCQRITGCSYKDVIGIARDSPIYYQMKKAVKDLNEARDTIARFEQPAMVA